MSARSFKVLAGFVGLVVVAAIWFGSTTSGVAGAAEPMPDLVCDGADPASTLPPESTTTTTAPPPAPGTPVPITVPPIVIEGIEQVRSYDIDIELRSDGSALFTEAIEYDFGSRPDRHGIFRDLLLAQPCTAEWERVYPLHDVQVASPSGAPDDVAVEHEGSLTRIRIGHPDKTVTGVHTYVVRYRLDGVANPFAEHTELYWDVVGDQWPVTLHQVDISIQGPAAPLRLACFTGSSGSTDPCPILTADGFTVHAADDTLHPYEGMTVAVAYPRDAFIETPRYYDEVWSLRRAFTVAPATVAGSAALLGGGVVAVVALGWVFGRDRRLEGSPTDITFAAPGAEGVPVPLFEDGDSPVEFAPPGGIRPAQLALVRNEEVRNVDVSATIVDLAVRGYLRIEESGGSKRRPDFRLVRLRTDFDELLSYERTLVHSLFPGSTGQVELDDLENRFAARLQSVKSGIYDDGVGRGWFNERPDKVKARWRGFAFLVVLVGAGLLGAAIAWTKLGLLPVPIILTGVLLFAFAGRFPRRTPAGTGLRRRIGGFELFMTDSEAPRARWAENRGIFSEYLPYAVALGLTRRWAKTFEPLGAEAIAATTGWYVGTQPFSFHRFASPTDRFASTTSRTLSSTPASSGSGSSGSSGFSGGSVGGGGGGGGGGSW